MNNGKIITFYSYKGGVGRTFILANVAVCLAQWGYNVLCIDWDLESPGLPYYFTSLGVDLQKEGLLELLADFPQEKQFSWSEVLQPISLPVSEAVTPDGKLALLSAGRQDNDYFRRVQSLDWAALYQDHGLGNYLEDFREALKDSFDFILVDSRTGITDIGGICTIQMPDVLAFVFTANHQSLFGVTDFVERVLRQHQQFPVDRTRMLTVPILSRFESGAEYKQAEEWMQRCSEKLAPFYSSWTPKDTAIREILTFTRIPHISYWSFEESLPAIEEDGKDPESISYKFQNLAILLIFSSIVSVQQLIKNRDSYIDDSYKKVTAGYDFDVIIQCPAEYQKYAAELRHALAENKLNSLILEFSTIPDIKVVDKIKRSRYLVSIMDDKMTKTDIEQIQTSFLSSMLTPSALDRSIIPVLTSRAVKPRMPQFLRDLQHLAAYELNVAEIANEIVRKVRGEGS